MFWEFGSRGKQTLVKEVCCRPPERSDLKDMAEDNGVRNKYSLAAYLQFIIVEASYSSSSSRDGSKQCVLHCYSDSVLATRI